MQGHNEPPIESGPSRAWPQEVNVETALSLRRHISITARKMHGHNGLPIGSRMRQKVKVVTPLFSRRHLTFF